MRIYANYIAEGKATLRLLAPLRLQVFISKAEPTSLGRLCRVLLQAARKNNKENASPTTSIKRAANLSPDQVLAMHKKKQRRLSDSLAFTEEQLNESRARSRLTFALMKESQIQERKNTQLAYFEGISGSMSNSQRKVMEAVGNGRNVFFTGSAGTGKSFILKELGRLLPAKTTFFTSSTGITALHICGTTIYHWASMSALDEPIDIAVRRISLSPGNYMHHFCALQANSLSVVQKVGTAGLRRRCWWWMKYPCWTGMTFIKKLRKTGIAILRRMFNKMEQVARAMRKNTLPFGGIQLVVCGDFLQLPPVAKGGNGVQFAFEAEAWRRCLCGPLAYTIQVSLNRIALKIYQQIAPFSSSECSAKTGTARLSAY
jgi:hypothetical protein